MADFSMNNHSSQTQEVKPQEQASSGFRESEDTLQKLASDEKRKTWLWVFLILGLFLLIMLAMIFAVVTGYLKIGVNGIEVQDALGIQQLITVLLPIFAGVALFVVAASGMKRLEMYDSEFARMRKERRQDARDLRDELLQRQDKFEESLKATVEEIAKNAIEGIIVDIKEDFKMLASEYRDEARRIADELDDKYKYLVDAGISSYSMAKDDFVSVGDVHRVVYHLFDRGLEEDMKKSVYLVKSLLEKAKEGRAAGVPEDWFNLSTELGKNNQERLAFEVCRAALKVYQGKQDWKDYQPDIDLLAHGIQFAGKVAEYETAEKWIAKAGELGRENWNWRLFTFIGDYYIQRGNKKKFDGINKDFQKYFPDDERSATQPAQYYYKRQQFKKAKEVLESWIENYKKKFGREPRAETVYYLLSEIALAEGDYDEALAAAERALGAGVTDQPHVNLSAAWFNKGAAYDGKLMQKLHALRDLVPGEADKREVAEFYRRALVSYSRAMEHGNVHPLMKSQARRRLEDMKAALQEHGFENVLAEIKSAETEKPQENDEKTLEEQFDELIRLFIKLAQEADDEGWEQQLKIIDTQFIAPMPELLRDVAREKLIRERERQKPKIQLRVNQILQLLGPDEPDGR